MPAPLLETTEFVKWRVNADDLALLQAVHGHGKVNEVVRVILHAYCDRIRASIPRSGAEGPLLHGSQTPPHD